MGRVGRLPRDEAVVQVDRAGRFPRMEAEVWASSAGHISRLAQGLLTEVLKIERIRAAPLELRGHQAVPLLMQGLRGVFLAVRGT